MIHLDHVGFRHRGAAQPALADVTAHIRPGELVGLLGASGSGRQILEYLLVAFLASATCAAFIAWGLDLFGLVPFAWVGPLITLNNFIAAALLGPVLLWLMYPRAKRWDILWTEIMEPAEIRCGRLGWLGVALMWVGGLGGLIAGELLSTGLYAGTTGIGVVAGMLPFLLLFLLGAVLA